MPLAVRRRILRQPTNEARQRARRGISLRGSGIGPVTEQRYLSAMSRLLPHLEQASTMQELDTLAEEWIETSWETGLPLGIIGDALCGVHFFWPQCRGFLRGSWRLFRNWRRLEIPQRAPPLPVLVAKAMVGLCLELQQYRLGFIIALSFHGYLRTGESLRLQFADITADALQGVLRIPASKSGLRFNIEEAVAIYDSEVLQLWHCLHAASTQCKWIHMASQSRSVPGAISRNCFCSSSRELPFSMLFPSTRGCNASLHDPPHGGCNLDQRQMEEHSSSTSLPWGWPGSPGNVETKRPGKDNDPEVQFRLRSILFKLTPFGVLGIVEEVLRKCALTFETRLVADCILMWVKEMMK